MRINMARARAERGLTQQEVADAVDVSRPYYANLESGAKNNPSFEVLMRLADFYDMPVDVLMAREERSA